MPRRAVVPREQITAIERQLRGRGCLKGGNGGNGGTGTQGPAGPAGPQGPKGDKGDRGDTGPQGATGATGSQGPQGNAGATGSQGPQGNQGPAGNNGSQGPQGQQGIQGIQGPQGPAASLSSAQAFATAETTVSAATYADIAGCSVSLPAGTWLIFGQVNIRAANAIVQAFVAITDGSNVVVSEVAASRPASGTASLNSPFSAALHAIVTHAGTVTYKLRGARGLTTHTGSWTAMDGAGTNTANHASNNSDKGSGIHAVKIA